MEKVTGKETLLHVAQALILAFMAFLLIFWRGKPQMSTLGLVFSGIVLEALPFMVIGSSYRRPHRRIPVSPFSYRLSRKRSLPGPSWGGAGHYISGL